MPAARTRRATRSASVATTASAPKAKPAGNPIVVPQKDYNRVRALLLAAAANVWARRGASDAQPNALLASQLAAMVHEPPSLASRYRLHIMAVSPSYMECQQRRHKQAFTLHEERLRKEVRKVLRPPGSLAALAPAPTDDATDNDNDGAPPAAKELRSAMEELQEATAEVKAAVRRHAAAKRGVWGARAPVRG